MDELTKLSIESACRRLVLEFARLNDNWDHDGVAELFIEDSSFARPIDPDNPYKGREAIRALFRDRPPRLSRHIMTNILIDVVSETEAVGNSYVTFLSSTDVDAPRPALAEPGIFVGAFDDKFVLTNDGWRFAARRGSMALRSGGEIPVAPPRQN